MGKNFATTLVALAALAATGAFAQVTVYGRLDVGYAATQTTTTNSGVSSTVNANGVNSHNSVSSMWGIKGTEDLGGGMNAYFQLEQDIYTANGNTGSSGAGGGAANASGFNRISKLGVNGSFGDVSFGRDYNAFFKMAAGNDVNNVSRLATPVLTAALGSTLANQIMYASPNFGGVVVNLGYGNDDSSNTAAGAIPGYAADQAAGTLTGAANDKKSRNMIATLSYTNGPLSVGFGTGQIVTNNGDPAKLVDGDAKSEASGLFGSYDFGSFKLLANTSTLKGTAPGAEGGTDLYSIASSQKQADAANLRNSNSACSIGVICKNIGAVARAVPGVVTTTNDMNIGVVVPMGKVTLFGQYGSHKTSTDAALVTDTSGTNYVLGADYALSAKTALFVKTGVYGRNSGTLIGDATYDSKITSTAVGLKTVF